MQGLSWDPAMATPSLSSRGACPARASEGGPVGLAPEKPALTQQCFQEMTRQGDKTHPCSLL